MILPKPHSQEVGGSKFKLRPIGTKPQALNHYPHLPSLMARMSIFMSNSNQPLYQLLIAGNKLTQTQWLQTTHLFPTVPAIRNLAQLTGFCAQGPSQAKVKVPGGLGLSLRAPLGKDSFHTRLLATFSSLCAIGLSSLLTVGLRLPQRPLHYAACHQGEQQRGSPGRQKPLSFVISQKLHPITFAAFYSLGGNHQVQPTLRGRGLHTNVNTRREDC